MRPDDSALPDVLAARLTGRVVLVGVGNSLLGDDGAGCLLARSLGGTPGLDVVEADDAPERFLGTILRTNPDVVVLADAVHLGADPGAVAILEKHELATCDPTAHRVPLSLITEYLERNSGADVFVLAIQPGRMELGAEVTPVVARSVESLARMIRLSRGGVGATVVPRGRQKGEAARC